LLFSYGRLKPSSKKIVILVILGGIIFEITLTWHLQLRFMNIKRIFIGKNVTPNGKIGVAKLPI